ncbi:MAG TPA: DNA mismatch repair protein MutS, partial [Patescibacteria group bacterium]
EQTIKDELARIHPAECLLPDKLYNDHNFLKLLQSEKKLNVFPLTNWGNFADNAKQILQKHFGVATLAGFGIADQILAQVTAAVLLAYLQETQKGTVSHIQKIQNISSDQVLLLDRSTVVNLELFATLREHSTKGSLLSVLDETTTAMGGRMLREWLKKPLLDKNQVSLRHDAVSELLDSRPKRHKLRETIIQISDIERLIAKLAVGLGNARDLVNLKLSLQIILEVKNTLANFDTALLKQLVKKIKAEDLNMLINLINKQLVPEPPISIREGNMIQTGINQELDSLRKIVHGSRDWILEMEQQERVATGIASLKVRFNQVFGFYIEVSKANLQSVPKHYMRKQTLVSAERFITPELKKQEEIILTAEEKINDLEYKIFQELLQKVLKQITILHSASESIATLDCLLNFAHLAEKNNYIRPQLLANGEIKIKNGRHPVVEKLLEDQQFVPNDVTLENFKQSLLLITGPNMAGKSVLIRQVALTVLMNQIGSFVPAEKAELSLVDRIFVRSGASDAITSGLSTFMVEMVETAHILHHATQNSLIIMDEIGRGTSTYDGISIAWAIAEYLVSNNQIPKTLFATHYHELQVLEEQYPKLIKNFHMSVADQNGTPIFLHTLSPGGASHSYGVAVAKLAGVPEQVINRAQTLLRDLEKRNSPTSELRDTNNNIAERVINKELETLDIANMTPLDALNKLSELKEKLKLFTMQEINLHAD